ncbi:ATP-binding cassette domain-containing protein [Bradyrhizobium betae]|uniref:ATP-binding cassette domain-containing protein n=1 Tax=Bradyrhizobium betae TaxID=244734 RepID=UPI001FCE3746|nr:ATP-binding cassette domain-containing protein [Bradyrhizobium betae]
MPVSSALSPQITTRFTQPVRTIADIEALEQRQYDSLIPARNLLHLFKATARLHPDRPALTVLTRGSREPDDVTLTHRQLLADIIRAANLFRSHGIGKSGGTAAFLCPILPPLFPALLGAQIAGVASSINYLLNEDAIADLLEAQNATVLVIPAEAADRAIWTKAANVAQRVPSLKTILVIGADGHLPGGFLNFDEARADGQIDTADDDDQRKPERDETDLSGLPRGVGEARRRQEVVDGPAEREANDQALTPEEKKYFFDLVRDLKKRGVSIVFISHALEEALLLADRITVLRDGKHVVTDDAAKFDRAAIIQAMVGRDLSNTLYGARKSTVRSAGARVLTVQNLKMAPMVKNNSLSVFAGQITGVFGLVGAGRTETFKIVSGVLKLDFFHGGEILLHDKPVRYRVPAPAVKAGIAYVTEDRKVEGFFETSSIARNIYLGLLSKFPKGRMILSRRETDAVGKTWIQKLRVRAIGDHGKVVELSGGNQQKVVIAKSLVQEPDLIIFDEPTRGVDVGAIVEIHELINQLADEGKAVVVISSYLPEIMALSDRILVSRQGKVVEEFSALDATEERIMYAAIH